MHDDINISKYVEKTGRAPLLKEIKDLKDNLNQRVKEDRERENEERDGQINLAKEAQETKELLYRLGLAGLGKEDDGQGSSTTERSGITNPQQFS